MSGKECSNRYKCEVQEDDQVVFVKLLVSDDVANKILGNSASIIKKIKQVNHVFILVSGANKYFPGTNYRVATMEGSEKNVNETLETLSFMLKSDSQMANSDDGRPSRNSRYTLRLAVPRSVIGSIIGIRGEFIRHVRTTTNAHINISPIFVTSEKACNERIITISANSSNHIVHAFIILCKKVNSSPEGRSCKGIIYKRSDVFRKGNNGRHFKVDSLSKPKVEETRNEFDNPKSTDVEIREANSITTRPKLNYKIMEGGRWSEHLSLLSCEEGDNGLARFDQTRECGFQCEKKLESPGINKRPRDKKIPTSVFIVSLVALVTGILFFQHVSKEVVYI